MKLLFLILISLFFFCHTFGQRIEITADSLLHYLQQADDIYACFDYDRKKDPVVRKFEPWTDEKDFYFNDSLKHILINLFNDSIGWARHTAKVVRQNLENDSEEDKCMALEGYLKRNYNKVFADSVLNNEKLFNQYFDSLCIYEEESSFKEDIKKRGDWNLPYSLFYLLEKSHFGEIYGKMLYYWKDEGCLVRGPFYQYLLNVDSPEVTLLFAKMLDNNEWDIELEKFLADNYSSESIKLLINALDKTYLVDGDLMEIDVAFNVKLLFVLNRFNSWFKEKGYLINSNLYYKIVDIIQFISGNIYKPHGNELMSMYVIENKNIIISFLESAYQKCLEEELYWKQNMPYYKSEK